MSAPAPGSPIVDFDVVTVFGLLRADQEPSKENTPGTTSIPRIARTLAAYMNLQDISRDSEILLVSRRIQLAFHTVNSPTFSNSYTERRNEFIRTHCNGVGVLGFRVADVDEALTYYQSRGREVIVPPIEFVDPLGRSCRMAVINWYEDTRIMAALVERAHLSDGEVSHGLPQIQYSQEVIASSGLGAERIDHMVFNTFDMAKYIDWFSEMGFSIFAEFPKELISSGDSVFESVVMQSPNGKVLLPVNGLPDWPAAFEHYLAAVIKRFCIEQNLDLPEDKLVDVTNEVHMRMKPLGFGDRGILEAGALIRTSLEAILSLRGLRPEDVEGWIYDLFAESKNQILNGIGKHQGSFLQHIAFHVEDYAKYLDGIREQGLEFMPAPDDRYYKDIYNKLGDILPQQYESWSQAKQPGIQRETIDENKRKLDQILKSYLLTAKRTGTLVDVNQDGILQQIFTDYVIPGTLFVEPIHRTCVSDSTMMISDVSRKAGCGDFGTTNFPELVKAMDRLLAQEST